MSTSSASWWRHEGLGTCFVTRDLFARAGRWPEYKSWGKEDDHFYDRVRALGAVVRDEVPGYFHQWHPNDVQWKDRYADVPAGVREERRQVKMALSELASIVPTGQTFLLVDEARFGIESIEDRRALPFLEKNGEYAGAPGDDATAIAELGRMRERGARFVAFAWPAFWWLDYYKAFAAHVAEDMRPVFENDRLKVFAWKDRR